MSRTAIDPAPFEPFLPESARALVAEARNGEGVAYDWLRGGEPGWDQPGISVGFWRDYPVALPVEVVGWLLGIAMFGDELNSIGRRAARHSIDRQAPFVLRAFGVGVRAGVPTQKRQWQVIESIAASTSEVPDELVQAIPLGLVSDQSLARSGALRLALKLGARARKVIEAARGLAETRAEKKAKKRLDEALAALGAESTTTSENALATPKTKSDLLARLLAAFAETGDPALSPAIAQLGREEASRRGALEAKSKGELEGAWLALAAKKDAGDVDRLLGTPWPGAWKSALARVEALRAFPPDPRIAEALPKIETQYDSFGSNPFHRAAKAVASRHRGSKKADAPAALLAEAAGSARRPVDLDVVWRDFRADPSDERRAVLADALQTLGDPRGEYIALSLAIAEGTADAAVRKRAAQLLDANIDAWTGPLPGANKASRRFERGFLARVQLKTKGPKLLASASAPEWCTVEELHLEAADRLEYHADALTKLLTEAPSLRALVFYNFGGDDLAKGLVGPFPRVTALGERSWMPDEKLAAFPALRLFGTSVHWYPPEKALDLAPRVGLDVVLLFGVQKIEEALAAFAAGRVREARFVLGGRSAFVEPEHQGWCLRVLRDSPRAELVWGGGRYEKGDLTHQMKALVAAGKTEIVVTLPKTGGVEAKSEADAFRSATVRTDGGPMALWKA